MEELVKKGLSFTFVNLSPMIPYRSEYLQNKVTGEILTNPLESILNCLADIHVLEFIAKALSIEPTNNNLDELFELIYSDYYHAIELLTKNDMIA